MGYNVENSNGNASNKAAALQIISSSIDAKYGLHLGLHLAAARIGYRHHGIYIGNGEVISYLRDPGITRYSVEEFSEGQQVYVIDHKGERCFKDNEIVERAISKIGESDYKLLTHNCEHFANWCVTGKEYSKQVQKATVIAAGLTGLKVLYDINKGRSPVPTVLAVGALAAFLSNDKVQDVIAEAADNGIEALKALFREMSDGAQSATTEVKSGVSSLTTEAQTGVTDITNSLKGVASSLANAIYNRRH